MSELEGYVSDVEDLQNLVDKFGMAVDDDDAPGARAVLKEIETKCKNLQGDLDDIITPPNDNEEDGD